MGSASFAPPANTDFPAKIGDKNYKLEVAQTIQQKARGLSYRLYLAKDQGMLFIFDQPGYHHFVMPNMNFPLDFVWINDDIVVDLTENVAKDIQGSFSAKKRFDKVIELNAGEIEKNNVKVNDKLYLLDSKD